MSDKKEKYIENLLPSYLLEDEGSDCLLSEEEENNSNKKEVKYNYLYLNNNNNFFLSFIIFSYNSVQVQL